MRHAVSVYRIVIITMALLTTVVIVQIPTSGLRASAAAATRAPAAASGTPDQSAGGTPWG